MDIIKLSVNHLNPGQVPVIALDQPLFAVGKEIQWNWSDLYGEKEFVVMFGSRHIEMAFLKVIGEWLQGSGWTTALADSNIATPGTAESFVKAASVTRSHRAHQVTACSLFILLQKAYTKYKEGVANKDDIMSFESWCARLLQRPSFNTGTQLYSLSSCFSFFSSRFGYLIFTFTLMGSQKCYHGFLG